MFDVAYHEDPALAGPTSLGMDEIDGVAGGIAPAIAIIGGGFGAGYTFGKDLAMRNNRRDDRRRR